MSRTADGAPPGRGGGPWRGLLLRGWRGGTRAGRASAVCSTYPAALGSLRQELPACAGAARRVCLLLARSVGVSGEGVEARRAALHEKEVLAAGVQRVQVQRVFRNWRAEVAPCAFVGGTSPAFLDGALHLPPDHHPPRLPWSVSPKSAPSHSPSSTPLVVKCHNTQTGTVLVTCLPSLQAPIWPLRPKLSLARVLVEGRGVHRRRGTDCTGFPPYPGPCWWGHPLFTAPT